MSKNKDSRLVITILLTFFAVVFAVDFSYIFIAQKTWRGIYTDNAYQKGLKYNKALEFAKQQQKLGWHFDTKFYQQNNVAKAHVCLLDKADRVIKNAKLKILFKRPVQEGQDFAQDLITQNNCYFANIMLPLKGQWIVEIQAFKDDDVFQDVRKIVIK